MSSQMFELLIFAAVAFFIINKLIATLGSTSDDDPTKRGSYFGESTLKDVTTSSGNSTFSKVKMHLQAQAPDTINLQELKELIVEENLDSIVKELQILQARMKSFQVSKFLRNAKMAFKMIIEYGNNENKEELAKLVDKRYLDQFQLNVLKYGTFLNFANIEAKISEIYRFGNNAFIRVLFIGENITTNIKNIKEEWTFSKSLNNNDVDWFLTNIDQL